MPNSDTSDGEKVPGADTKITETLPATGLRVPVPEREDVMAALRKVSEPEPDEDSDEQP